jgi:hypothetical protein
VDIVPFFRSIAPAGGRGIEFFVSGSHGMSITLREVSSEYHGVPHVRPAQQANVGFFVLQMPKNLLRCYGKGDLHFITLFECRGYAMSLSRRRAAAVVSVPQC